MHGTESKSPCSAFLSGRLRIIQHQMAPSKTSSPRGRSNKTQKANAIFLRPRRSLSSPTPLMVPSARPR